MKKFIAIATAMLGVLVLSGCSSQSHVGCTVNDKESISKEDGHEYRIHTSCGVFKNTDSMVHGKWDSADFQNSIEIGQTYDFDTYGYRIGFLSEFENIVGYTLVEE